MEDIPGSTWDADVDYREPITCDGPSQVLFGVDRLGD